MLSPLDAWRQGVGWLGRDPESARYWFERALAAQPLFCDAWVGVLCCLPPGSPEHDQAIGEVLDRLADFGRVNRTEGRPLRPAYLVGHFTSRPLLDAKDVMIAAAGVLERRGQHAQAVTLLESCPTRGDSWYLARGVVFHQLGRYAGAVQSLKVVTDEISRVEAEYWMGLSTLMTGSIDAGEVLLESAAARTDNLRMRGECEYYLAHCLRLRGDEPAARVMFERAWQAMPSDDVLDDRDNPRRRLTVPGVAETMPAAPPREPIGSVLDDVDALVGLLTVKDQVHRLIARQVMDRERGRAQQAPARHLAFLAAPGSGTSTVARLVARAHHSLGVLARDRVIETSGPALLADTAAASLRRMNDVVDRAIGAVLLIDDAPVLLTGSVTGDSGERDDAVVVRALAKRMYDERDRLIVILGGEPSVLEPLIDHDDRLRSLVASRLRFEAHSVDDLLEIVERLAARERVAITSGAREEMKALFANAQSSTVGTRLGTVRFARDLFGGAADARDVRRLRERTVSGRDADDVVDAHDVRAAFELLRRELDPG